MGFYFINMLCALAVPGSSLCFVNISFGPHRTLTRQVLSLLPIRNLRH